MSTMSLKAVLLAAVVVAAKSSLYRFQPWTQNQVDGFTAHHTPKRAASRFLTEKTRPLAVNGSGIPNVGFDVGESYAGLLPVDDGSPDQQLYYWFFPSANPAADKEILIWLTGGPGCSSAGELTQENGPFLWQPGTFAPVENPWSWHRLTNVVWIDQPVGSGFSVGNVTARDEADVARQLMGFWKNFVDTFALQGYKVYITGSSYSGMYCPFVASAMLDAADPAYFDVAGMMVFDGLFSGFSLAQDLPVAAFVDQWDHVLPLNASFKDDLRQAAQTCGFADYRDKYLVFPPAGPQPAQLPGIGPDGSPTPGCDLSDRVFAAAADANPCFSPYDVFVACPRVYDPLGFSDGSMFVAPGSGPPFLDRPDVKRAIHAPDQPWVFCTDAPVFVGGVDASVAAGPGSQAVLPGVIDRTHNVIIGHGARDFVLVADGTLLAIQNLTWGGVAGFQTAPANSTPLAMPALASAQLQAAGVGLTSGGGSGVVGTVHAERGLTYLAVDDAGHFLAMDQPQVAFRALEALLGRVDGFDPAQPFTVEVGGGSSNGSIVAAGFAGAGGDTSGGSRTEPWPILCVLFWVALVWA